MYLSLTTTSANKSTLYYTGHRLSKFYEVVNGGLRDKFPSPSWNIMAIKHQTVNMASQEKRHVHKNIYKQS